MQTYPELNAANSSERLTDRWASTVLGESDFDLAYLATAFVATTDLRYYVDTFQVEIFVNRRRSDAGTLEELYAFDALPDLDALAEAQGVSPTTDVRSLATDTWPEDESVEDFIAAAMEGRHEEDEPGF